MRKCKRMKLEPLIPEFLKDYYRVAFLPYLSGPGGRDSPGFCYFCCRGCSIHIVAALDYPAAPAGFIVGGLD